MYFVLFYNKNQSNIKVHKYDGKNIYNLLLQIILVATNIVDIV